MGAVVKFGSLAGLIGVCLMAVAMAAAQQPSSPPSALGAGPGSSERSITREAPPGSALPSADPRDISGVWTIVNNDQFSAFELKDEWIGRAPPPESFGKTVSSVETRECKPSARFGGLIYPMQIIQTPGLITIIQEEHRRTRRIFLNRSMPAQPVPYYYGTSVGHWEGDTLVVETAGLKGEQQFGLIATPEMRVIERIRKIDQGKRLEVQVAHFDDLRWNKPAIFRVRYNWRPDQHLLEYACEQFSDPFGKGYDSIR